MTICVSTDGILLVLRRHFAGIKMSFCGPNTVNLRVESCHFAHRNLIFCWSKHGHVAGMKLSFYGSLDVISSV